ncbi:MAG: Nif3-like dinuclear metal center hexameric protein [Treponema sp.]|nr:Nif3-like dinuclear metal center hexameric protein [Treponema sp.]
MNLLEIDDWFNRFLKKEYFQHDPSRNGIQIANSAPGSKEIKKVAFAVDACEETALKAAELKCDLLFVHHGLFWGDCTPVTGIHYRRIAAFIKNDLALCAYHIPLDANNPYGNNFGIASRLGLTRTRPFGEWRGMTLGAMGELETPVTIEELEKKLFPDGQKANIILPFGKKMIKSVAIISGGAGEDFEQASECGADAFITGEISHECYHPVKESGLNVIAGGHYATETVGVNLVRQKLEEETGIKTVFIDIPTRL